MAVLRRPVALAVVSLFLMGALGVMAGPSSPAASSCPNSQFRAAACGPPPGCESDSMFIEVAGQGPSCPNAAHLWWVRTSSGDYLQTHGPDMAPPGTPAPGSYSALASPTGGSIGTSASDPYGGYGSGPYEAPDTTNYVPGFLFEGDYRYADSQPPVTCTPPGQDRQVFIYAVPAKMKKTDTTNTGSNPLTGIDYYNHGGTTAEIKFHRATTIAIARDMVKQTNLWLFYSAMTHGGNRTYRFQCDADGQVSIFHAVLPTSNDVATIGTITGDLAKLGYKDPKVKYWVYYAVMPGPLAGTGVAGQGSACPDSRPIISNCSLGGTGYAVDYAYNGTSGFFGRVNVLMHEGGHTLGAVQNNSPNTSGSAHCNDGWDIMCYQDGGPTACTGTDFQCGDTCVQYSSRDGRAKFPYDCGQDDYFGIDPSTGNYLATNWNIAAALDDFIAQGRNTRCADHIDNNGNNLVDSLEIGCANPRDDDEGLQCGVSAAGFAQDLPCTATGPGGVGCVAHPGTFSPEAGEVWKAICGQVDALPPLDPSGATSTVGSGLALL